jgi:circadian clock protein KaiC
MVRQTKADLVVLDGFRGVRGVDLDPQAARQFLYDIGSSLSIVGKMSIVTSEADPRDPLFFPEATTADVILGLHYGIAGVRQRRKLEVIKMRGAAPLPGLHGMELTREGVGVYPRLEARVSAESAAAGDAEQPIMHVPATATNTDGGSAAAERVSTGIDELDTLLGGGLTRGTATLLTGNLGTGKTLLSLVFALHGVAQGEPTVLLGFRESRDQLLLKADAFDLGRQLRQAMAHGGLLRFIRHAPIELNPDIVAHELFAEIDRTGARRLVIDSIAEMEQTIEGNTDPARMDNYLAALVEGLRLRGVTSLFVKEIRQAVGVVPEFREESVSVVVGNVLLVQQVEQQGRLHRVCSVLKMRFSAHDSTLHEFVIQAPDGIRMLGPFQASTGTLTGFAQPPSAPNQPEAGG